jgi:hypothetical protein
MGSPKFAALLAELLLLSHGLVVAVSAVASSYIPDYKYLWFSSCAVGFSAVIFALKVVLFHDSPGYSSVFGFSLPTKVGVVAGDCGCVWGGYLDGSWMLHRTLQVPVVQQLRCGFLSGGVRAEGGALPRPGRGI